LVSQVNPAATEQGLGLLLVQLCRAHRNLVASALETLNVHVGQEHVVYRLGIEQGMTQSRLTDALRVDASTVTKMLQRLERDGIVKRQSDAADARVQRVFLTPGGARLVQPVVDIWADAEDRLQAGMTDAERALLRRLLQQMVSNLA
jgi:MarR family transcriptional regulator, organic hydroperoxide resistance regulator